MRKVSLKSRIMGIATASLFCTQVFFPFSARVTFADGTKTFDIIEITDFHGSVVDSKNNPVAGVLAKNIQDIKKANSDGTVVVGGGDLYQGSAMSNLTKGKVVQKVLNSIGMEVSTVGNHEFDWGLDTVTKNTEAKYDFISSNLYNRKTGKREFAPYKMIEKNGFKIAFVGGTTESCNTSVLAANIKDYELKNMTNEVNTAAADAKANGANAVIALVHEGSNPDCKTGVLFDIAKDLKGVDAVLGGHSHTIVSTTLTNGLPVEIGASNGQGFIDLKMSVDADGKISFPNATSAYVAINNDGPNGYKAAKPSVDEDVTKIVADTTKELGPVLSEKIGEASVDITRTQSAAPFGESLAGNWSTDAMRAAGEADFAFQNDGGLRCDLPKGAITAGQIWQYMPFDNTIVKFKMTAPQIKAILEEAIGVDPTTNTGAKGAQVSGLKYVYDADKMYGNRVYKITKADGTPIDLKDTKTTYTVATNDFMATGGDGFSIFTTPEVKKSYDDTHIVMRDLLIDTVKQQKTVKPELDGRIQNVSDKDYGTINLVATSDIHSNIYPLDYFSGNPADQGLARVSTYVKDMRKKHPDTMLIDNGDTIQGTPLGSLYSKDLTVVNPMIKVMGAMKYDAWVLGNHEFNFGLDTLNKAIKDAQSYGISVLSANTYKDGKNFVSPYIIKTVNTNVGAVKVGVLGLTTKCIPEWENPNNYKDLSFKDLVDEAKKWVPVMKNEGADVVVVSMHSGEEGAADVIPENEVKAVAGGVDGIDAIVAGHAHSKISQDVFKSPSGKDVIVTEPGKWGQFVSHITIGVVKNDNKVAVDKAVSEVVPMDSSVKADTAVTDDIAKPYQDATLKYINTVIGKAAGEFSGKTQTVEETALMDLVNEVQLKAANSQLSIAAPLSSAARIPAGDITIKDICSVYTFENYLYTVKMTGAQIKKWLEYSVRYYAQTKNANDPVTKDAALNIPDYYLDMLYGASYTIDLTGAAGSRIKDLTYNGKPVSDDDVFTVAINNYRYNGGGGFMKAAGLTPGSGAIWDSAKELGDDGQVRNLMIKYIQDQKTINPEVKNFWKVKTN